MINVGLQSWLWLSRWAKQKGTAVGCTACTGRSWKAHQPAKRNLPFEGAATTLLGIYPKGLKTSVYPNTCTHILTSASLIVAKTWK